MIKQNFKLKMTIFLRWNRSLPNRWSLDQHSLCTSFDLLLYHSIIFIIICFISIKAVKLCQRLINWIKRNLYSYVQSKLCLILRYFICFEFSSAFDHRKFLLNSWIAYCSEILGLLHFCFLNFKKDFNQDFKNLYFNQD